MQYKYFFIVKRFYDVIYLQYGILADTAVGLTLHRGKTEQIIGWNIQRLTNAMQSLYCGSLSSALDFPKKISRYKLCILEYTRHTGRRFGRLDQAYDLERSQRYYTDLGGELDIVNI